MTRGASVRFDAVSKAYGQAKALEDFSLDIRAGEFLTLLGASGSGKTTALNLLAGFLQQTAGGILINGRDVSGLPPEKRNIGVVFQNYSLFPHLSVEANIAYPLKMRGAPAAEIRERTARVLEVVRMGGFARRMPKELSGGQQQRVAFARAIVYEPPLLLMDEPLGALDQNLRESLQAEIKDYHRQLGCTIVFVTHDQREALILSDRIAVLHGGSLEQIGTPAEIYDHPASRYIAGFIGQSNILPASPAAGGVAVPALGLELRRPHDGAPLVAVIRPEKLKLGGGAHSLSGRVRKVTFLGDCLTVEVASGDTVLLAQLDRAGAAAAREGEAITLAFDPEDVILVPDGPARR